MVNPALLVGPTAQSLCKSSTHFVVCVIQKRVLKSIFPGKCYNDILNHTGISSLKERRDHLCRKYFNDMKVNSHKLNHLLPEKRQVEYDLRPVNAYPLLQTRTDRYRNSIIPWGLFHWQ